MKLQVVRRRPGSRESGGLALKDGREALDDFGFLRRWRSKKKKKRGGEMEKEREESALRKKFGQKRRGSTEENQIKI